MNNTARFEALFDDARQGLIEYFSVLKIDAIAKLIESKVQADLGSTLQDSQAAYARIRDLIESHTNDLNNGPHYKVEIDKQFFGGDCSNVSDFYYIPQPLADHLGSIQQAFSAMTGLPHVHIVNTYDDERYNSQGDEVGSTPASISRQITITVTGKTEADVVDAFNDAVDELNSGSANGESANEHQAYKYVNVGITSDAFGTAPTISLAKVPAVNTLESFSKEFGELQARHSEQLAVLAHLSDHCDFEELSEYLDDCAADLKDIVGSQSANDANDEREQDQFRAQAERWITDNISNAPITSRMAAVLYLKGPVAGLNVLRKKIEEIQHNSDTSKVYKFEDEDSRLAAVIHLVKAGIAFKYLESGQIETQGNTDAIDKLIQSPQTSFCVVQEGGSSTEIYLGATDTQEAADELRKEYSKASYRSSESVEISRAATALGELFFSDAAALLTASLDFEYFGEDDDDDDDDDDELTERPGQ